MELILKSGTKIKTTAKQEYKPAPWDGTHGKHYKIRATVGSKSFSFDFWDSHHNMIFNVPCDERGALGCWASDVFAGMNAESADDIASEFGYTKPSDALRVFKGVKRAEKQYNRIGMSEEDLQELSDY